MSDRTKIEWADSTFNPVIGCTKISPGCDGCYAAAQDNFRHWTPEGWGGPRKRTSPGNWKQPIQWQKWPFGTCPGCGWRGEYRQAQLTTICPSCGHVGLNKARRRVFCASLSDVFDNEWDPAWRADLFKLIADTPNLDWLLLTKRIGNAQKMMDEATRTNYFGNGRWEHAGAFPGVPLKNVWLGATVVNQAEADRDIPKLLTVPAAKRFLSIEPMLSSIDLSKYIDYCEKLVKHGISRRPGGEHIVCDAHCGISWVIAGGESGPKARPSHPDWYRGLRDQCAAAGVPYLFKQWGEWIEPDVDGMPVRLTARSGDPEFLDAASTMNGFLCVDGRFASSVNAMEKDVPYLGLRRIGKKAAGRLLDGVEHSEFPS